MNLNAVKKWSSDALLVFDNNSRCISTWLLYIQKISAWAGMNAIEHIFCAQ
jgi:hypothetical protein